MSRIGKKLIAIPNQVTINIDDQKVTVKGPKGELSHTLHPEVKIAREDDTIKVERAGDQPHQRALHGLTRALVANMVTGVSTGFQKTLVIEGVGYSGELRGTDLVMKLGYSHEIVVSPPQNVSFAVEKLSAVVTNVHIRGIDKQVVGQVAADIRELRPPEPYKGKGVRYSDERIRRKAGKTGK